MPITTKKAFFVSGGTLPPDSASYIERTSDDLLLEALKRGSYCYILNTRQMGKSSLSVRTISKLNALGIRTAFVDLTQIGGRNVTPDQWYTGLVGELGRSLGVRAEMLAYCKQHSEMSPMQRFFGALREVALQKIETPLVLFIDEIDATKNLAFNTDEFFAGIRECFNRRVHDADMNRLTFCLLGVAVPSDLISNPATTPFNIGERIHLQDFTLRELQRFAPQLGSNGATLIERIHYWTNGQPFLTQSLCQTVAARDLQKAAEVDGVVFEQFFGPKARDTNINLADVANRALNGGANEEDPDRFRADLLSTYERAWKGHNVKDDEANRIAVVLKLSGLMRTEGARLKVRNQIYQQVFDQSWVRDSMPDQELRRQEQSYRRGLIRGIASAAVIVATITVLGLIAWRSRQEAVAAQGRLDYELYVADMNGMRLFEEKGDIGLMEQVLGRTKNSRHRGFEWGFWNGRLHDSSEEYTLDYTAPGKREDGIISRDGVYLCVTDDLLRTATLVNRTTKKALATQRLSPQSVVVSTSRGLLILDSGRSRITVRDLLTGEKLYDLGSAARLGEISLPRYADHVFFSTGPDWNKGATDWEVWDITTGKKTWSRPADLKASRPPVFADKGQRLFYTLHPDKTPEHTGIIFDIAKNAVVDRFPWGSGGYELHHFSDSGGLLLYWNREHALIARDTNSKKTLFNMAGTGPAAPLQAQATPDDKYVVCLYTTGRATIHDGKTGQVLASRNNVWSISPSGDGKSLIVGSSSVRVVPYTESAGARFHIQGVRLARDGAGRIRVFRDGVRRLLVLSDPGLEILADHKLPDTMSSTTYNGKWLMRRVGDPATASVIEAVDGNVEPLEIPPATNFSAGAFGDVVAVHRDVTNTLQGISLKTRKKLWDLKTPDGLRGMWMTPDGKRLLVLTQETALAVLDPQTGERVATLAEHNVRLTNVVFPNSKVFFTCGADGRSILWDTEKLKVIQQFRGNAVQRISGADISPDGSRVATCSFAGSWQLWDAKTGVELMDFQASDSGLRGILFTADGKSLVTAGEDKQIKVWTILPHDPSVKIPVSKVFSEGIKR